MENLQNKAMRRLNFKPSRFTVNPLYSEVEILKFSDSINLSNFLLAHDCISGNLPSALQEFIKLANSNHLNATGFQQSNQLNIPQELKCVEQIVLRVSQSKYGMK